MSEQRRPRIVVVGSLNLDLVYHVARLPQPGETLTGTSFQQMHGGKGANQAVAAAMLACGMQCEGAPSRADLEQVVLRGEPEPLAGSLDLGRLGVFEGLSLVFELDSVEFFHAASSSSLSQRGAMSGSIFATSVLRSRSLTGARRR